MKKNAILSIRDFGGKASLDKINLIWIAIMQMNKFSLFQLLDDAIDYEDIGKVKFIEKLADRYENHRTWGDSELLLDLDHCNGCHRNQPVSRFVGNNSGKHFALFFEIENGKIKDIYHCNWYGKNDDLPF